MPVDVDESLLHETARLALAKCHYYSEEKGSNTFGMSIAATRPGSEEVRYVQCFPIANAAYASSRGAGLMGISEVLCQGFCQIEAVSFSYPSGVKKTVSAHILEQLKPYCLRETRIFTDVASKLFREYLPLAEDVGERRDMFSEAKRDVDDLVPLKVVEGGEDFAEITKAGLAMAAPVISKFAVSSTIVFEALGKRHYITRGNQEITDHEHDCSCAEGAAISALLIHSNEEGYTLDDVTMTDVYVSGALVNPQPCGNCRQLLNEFKIAEDASIYSCHGAKIKEVTPFVELFPKKFGRQDLIESAAAAKAEEAAAAARGVSTSAMG